MDFLRKTIIGFVSSTLVILVSLYIFNATFSDVVVNGLFSEGLKSFLSENQSSIFVTNPDVGGEESMISEEVINSMMNSEEMREMINEFSQVMINEMGNGDISSEEMSNYDFGQKMMDFLNNNKEAISEETGMEITDETINNFSSQIKNGNFDRNMESMINTTKSTMSPEQQEIFSQLSSFTSLPTKNKIIFGIIGCILLIILLSWSFYKWLSPIGKSFIIGSIFPIGIAYLAKQILTSTINIPINVNPIINLSYKFIIAGVVIEVLYVIINIFMKRKETVNDVVPRITNTSA